MWLQVRMPWMLWLFQEHNSIPCAQIRTNPLQMMHELMMRKPPSKYIVNPDAITGLHDNQFRSCDVPHQDQDLCHVWSMYLELEQRYSQNLFGI